MAASSLDAMDRMIRLLTQLEQALQDVDNQLKREYDVIGTEWDDKQYKNLGDIIGDISTSLGKNYSQISECTLRIQLLKSKLEEYLNT